MGKDSNIQWTQHTWNPIIGCHKISPGCANCYMFAGMRWFGRDLNKPERTKSTWRDPFKWDKLAEELAEKHLVFTCSWSDWFIEEFDAHRLDAWGVIYRTQNLIFQILTKRAERIPDHLPVNWGDGYPNAWLGVSVEDRRFGLPRIDQIRSIPAAMRFLSVEPLLEDLGEINLDGIGWVIIGGESDQGGAKGRPFDVQWARNLIRQCRAAGVPVFVKQLGSHPYESEPDDGPEWPVPLVYGNSGFIEPVLRDSHGGDWDEWPEDLRVREMPAIAEATR